MEFETAHAEVVRLHDFFAAWFRGELPEDAIETSLADALHKEFEIVPPSGAIMDRNVIIEAIRSARNTNPEFQIAIEEPRLLGSWPGFVLFQYVEHQFGIRPTGSEDRRLATVLFERNKDTLIWRYLTEVGLST